VQALHADLYVDHQHADEDQAHADHAGNAGDGHDDPGDAEQPR